MKGVFDSLTPESIIEVIEEEKKELFTGLITPLPSYINRVYEIESMTGERYIAKFYRPGRWSLFSLKEEHQFILDCANQEIPVVAPVILSSGSTLGKWKDCYFTLFPKKSGRELLLESDAVWRRLGSLIGRMHLVGMKRSAENRLIMHPTNTTIPQRDKLLSGGWMSKTVARDFSKVIDEIVEIALPLFEDIKMHRIHGDCHRANILERPNEGLMIIDFDDMVTGPAIQDLWLLLPGYTNECNREIDLILEGYELFLDFDDRQLKMIEVLRAMRMIYFLAWCSTQIDDYRFVSLFPDWGSEQFWLKEIADLQKQLNIIKNCKYLRMDRYEY